MTPKSNPPAVVAELGRPETPEETAARKARDSANHRNRQTLINLILALGATLVIVLIVIFMVPRAAPQHEHVDYAAVAAKAAGSEPDPLVAPGLPNGWYANSAELRTKTADGIDSWHIGLITADEQYVGIAQGFDANRTWLAEQVNHARASGKTTVDGVRWTVYDNRDVSDHGNVAYALATTAGHSTYVVFGTASTGDIRTVAQALADDVRPTDDGKAS